MTPYAALPAWHPDRVAYEPREHRTESLFWISAEEGGSMALLFDAIRQADRTLARIQHKAAVRRMISTPRTGGAV